MKKLVLLLILLLSITISSCSNSNMIALKITEIRGQTKYFFQDSCFDLKNINLDSAFGNRLYYYVNRKHLIKYDINYNLIYDNVGPHFIYDLIDNELIQLEDFHYYFTKNIDIICDPFEKQEYKVVPSINSSKVKEVVELRYRNDRIIKAYLEGVYIKHGEYLLNNCYYTRCFAYRDQKVVYIYDELDTRFRTCAFDRNLPIHSLQSVFNLNIDNKNILCYLFVPIYYDLVDIDINQFNSYYYEKEMKLINNEIEEYDLKIYLKYNNKDYLINQLTYIRDVTHNYYYANYETIDPNNYPKYDKDGNIYRTTYTPFEFYLNNEDILVEYAETFRDNMERMVFGE